jgi:AraC family transcriptional regulator of adaptative response/methylated-DNA-[protein]-cysteine methyltransferase
MNTTLRELSRDYRRIAAAIEYLDDQLPEQPDLQSVARHVHLSQAHLQRVFSRWAGVSPKRFLQYLTLDYTKDLLRNRESVLAASAAAGLSSVSRIHDLYVSCEGVSPNQYGRGGVGLAIDYGFHATPFGECLAAATDRGLCCLRFVGSDRSAALAELRKDWPRAQLRKHDRRSGELVERIFARPWQADKPLCLNVKGTNFQIQVWQALLKIPGGGVLSYSDLAARLGRAGASRAVAGAVARNPIHYLIPCHRVIRNTGAFGGYHAGVTRKRVLLGWEAARLHGR